MEKLNGVMVPELHPEPPPPELIHVWRWFSQLANRRTGLARLSYAELAAWSALTGVRPTPREIDLIVRLDDAFLNIMTGRDASPEPLPATTDNLKAAMRTLMQKPGL